MKVYLALAAIGMLVPFYLIGLAANMLIIRVWSWATE
jgi:hypothetical protein